MAAETFSVITIDEDARRRFEASWHAERPQAIEDFLPASDQPHYLTTLEELIHIELEFAWKVCGQGSGVRPAAVETYLARFPRLNQPVVVRRLLEQEYRVRHRFGDRPPLAEYDERFPGLMVDGHAIDPTLPDGRTGTDEFPEIPGYQILSFLGRGGMGVVYKARQISLNRIVALKMLLAESYSGEKERVRFQAEAEAAARLQHPHIVQIHEFGQTRNCPYLALEFVDGGTLAQRLASTPQPAPSSAQFIEIVARAIHVAHEHGIVHRDLKPGNILLVSGGVVSGEPSKNASTTHHSTTHHSPLTPKIADFGLAKLLDSDSQQTTTGATMGTPSYMAPEQAHGRTDQIGPTTDVYALGAVLYEMLTGRPPFRGETPLSTLQQVRTQEPVPPSRLHPKVPRDLETICLKCLQKEPPKRYRTALALAEDLHRYLAGEPIRARRVGYAGRLVRWCRRKPALASTIGSAALAILVVTAVSFQQIAKERDRFRSERDRAEANLYRSLIGEARAQMEARSTGWWWNALDNLRKATRLDVAGRDPAELRELAIECLGSQYPCLRLAGTWAGHAGAVTSVAISPDGRLAASGSVDGTVRLWRLPDGHPWAVLDAHRQPITSVRFHPDGRHVASGSLDGLVRVWTLSESGVPTEAQGHEVVRVIPLEAGAVGAVAYSADGGWLGAACADGKLRLIPADPAAAIRVLPGHSGPIYCLAFSPQGRLLVTGGADRTLRLWDLITGKPTASWSVTNVAITLSFSADGNSVAWADRESYGLSYKNLSTQAGTNQAHMHSGAVNEVVYLKKGLLAASEDGTLKIWDGHRGSTYFEERAVARGESGAVSSVAAGPGERQLIAGYQDGQVRLWEAADFPHRALLGGDQNAIFIGTERRLVSGSLLHDFTGPGQPSTRSYLPSATRALVVHPDGRRFALGRDNGQVQIWDLEQRCELRQWPAHEHGVRSLTTSPGGQYLASASAAEKVKVWSWDSGQLEEELDPHIGPIHQVAWSQQTRWLAATGELGTVVWDRETQTEAFRLGERTPIAAALAFGSGLLALAGDSSTVEIREIGSWQKLRTLRGHTAAVKLFQFSVDGNRLASASDDDSIRLWNPATGQEETVLRPTAVPWLSLQPNGRYLVCGGYRSDGTVIWDCAKRTLVARIDHQVCPCGGQFVRNGSAFLLGSASGGVSLCNVTAIDRARAEARGSAAGVPYSGVVTIRSTESIVPGGHLQRVWGVAASPDGRWVATAAHDGSVKLWDGRDMHLVRTLAGHEGVAWCVDFSPDGRYLASGGAGVKIWEVATGREVHGWNDHKAMVSTVAIHPNGRWVASGSNDGTIRIYEIAAGKSLGVLHQGAAVNKLAFRPDGRWLACASQDRQIRLWDLSQGLPTLPAPPDRTLLGHSAGVWSVGWSADGLNLASGSDQGVIILWDGERFAKLVTLRGGTGQIRSISFSRDGNLLAGAAYASETIVWDLSRLHQTLCELNVDW